MPSEEETCAGGGFGLSSGGGSGGFGSARRSARVTANETTTARMALVRWEGGVFMEMNTPEDGAGCRGIQADSRKWRNLLARRPGLPAEAALTDGPAQNGKGGVLTFTDTGAASAGQRFYRVFVAP